MVGFSLTTLWNDGGGSGGNGLDSGSSSGAQPKCCRDLRCLLPVGHRQRGDVVRDRLALSMVTAGVVCDAYDAVYCTCGAALDGRLSKPPPASKQGCAHPETVTVNSHSQQSTVNDMCHNATWHNAPVSHCSCQNPQQEETGEQHLPPEARALLESEPPPGHAWSRCGRCARRCAASRVPRPPLLRGA